VLAAKSWTSIHPRAFVNLWGMLDLTSAWHNTAREGGGICGVSVDELREENYVEFFAGGRESIWRTTATLMTGLGGGLI
jgi:hypothetical protein